MRWKPTNQQRKAASAWREKYSASVSKPSESPEKAKPNQTFLHSLTPRQFSLIFNKRGKIERPIHPRASRNRSLQNLPGEKTASDTRTASNSSFNDELT